ncbi:MAG: Type 4 prepilin-like protein leader peptide-processing enzyme [Parcubacteria group bacterium GW2011_GWB1_43_8]|nr:MAG: Type 4 prepilin-like protein leader peptide-processing enzyme [Parcubacteria group bacterium GW2011_GWB1_43_8]
MRLVRMSCYNNRMGVDFFAGIIIFLFGAVVGSFLNVVILRLNTGQSIVSGRSKCFSCAKKLKWYELLPIASFIFLRGKCSACKTKISWQYPITEIITGLLFLLIFNFQWPIFNEFSFYFIIYTFHLFVVFSILIIIAVYDYRHQIIPNLFVWIFNILAFLNLFVWDLIRNSDLEIRNFDYSSLLSGFILFSFFALLWGVSRGRWMGFGDAKLALGIGWLLGITKGITAITLAFWIGAVVGVLLIYLNKNKYGLKSSIAFGPFMILGTAVSFFWGEKIIGFLF